MRNRNSVIAIGLSWFIFWAMMVSVAVQDYLRDHGTALWQPVLWESSSILFGALMMFVQRHFMRRYDYLLARPWRWLGANALWLPLWWLVFTPVVFGIRHAVYGMMGMQYTHAPWPETFLYESLKLTVFVSMFILITFGILSYFQMVEEKLRVEKANGLLRQASLLRLRQQMQPHFLFNALNTISSLMHTDVDKADATLIKLADVLRATLDVSEMHEAPLSTELRLVQGYAHVMQERYAERVAIGWEIAPDALPCVLPVMSLQPLLENIFKHTVEQRRGTTRIEVSAWREAGRLNVRLDDDQGTLAPGASPGIGVANLRERLEMLYGGAASLALTQLQPAGVRAELRVPCAS